VNNKKIAKFIDKSTNPNHVRFVKSAYLRSLKKRAKQEKVTCQQRLDLDISEFDITIFEKAAGLAK